MRYTTQGGWWHNRSRMQWEARDQRGQVVATVADEVMAVNPEGVAWWFSKHILATL